MEPKHRRAAATALELSAAAARGDCGGGAPAAANQRPFTFFSPRPYRRTLPKNKRIKVGETYLFLCGASKRASMRG